MANPAGSDAWSGAQKDAYAKQYGGYWNGSQYSATGTAPVAAPPKPVVAAPVAAPIVAPKPVVAAPVAAPVVAPKPVVAAPVATPVAAKTTTPAAPPPPTITSNAAAAQQTISKILQQPLGLNQNDPVFQTGRAAINLEAQRQREAQQSQAAERLSTQGLNQAGAMDTAAGQARQNEGAARLGGLNTLMNNQATQQQQSLQQALSLAQGAGLTQSAQEIQQKLADLAAQVQREGYATQTGIAGQSNATNMTLGKGQLNLGLLNALLGNQQFNDNLGANIGANQASLTQQYLLSLFK